MVLQRNLDTAQDHLASGKVHYQLGYLALES